MRLRYREPLNKEAAECVKRRIGKYPFTVEVDCSKFPWAHFDIWSKSNLFKYHCLTEDCMGQPGTKISHDYAIVSKEWGHGTGDTRFFLFRSAGEYSAFVQEYEECVVDRNPFEVEY